MKLISVAAAASIASVALAKTVYVTHVNTITINANGEAVGAAPSPSSSSPAVKVVVVTEGAQTSYTPTTLVTVTGSYSSISQAVADTSVTSPALSKTVSTSSATPFEPSSSATSSAASSDDSVYADISSSGVDSTFAKNILDAHNKKRADHSVGSLLWDTTVYQYAQAYADQYTCGAALKHSGGKYGENLALGFDSGVSAFDAWYSEGDNYDFSSASSFDHFTAIIWKGTTKLGCAYKNCGSGMYVICSYDPAGNVIGYGKENLFAS